MFSLDHDNSNPMSAGTHAGAKGLEKFLADLASIVRDFWVSIAMIDFVLA